MLTSTANQYLRPDYLTPLPTTLDAKKSPLALLAQTCSQIGADPPPKSLLTSLDKSSNKSTNKSRDNLSPPTNSTTTTTTTPSESTKSSFKPYESCLTNDKISASDEQQRAPSSHSVSGRSRTPGSKRCSSNQSASSTSRAMTPQGRKTATPNDQTAVSRESPVSRTESTASASVAHRGDGHSPKSTYSSSQLPMADPSQIKDLQLGSFKSTATSLPSAVSTAYLPYPSQLSIDAMTNSFVSHHHAALKSSLASANPYLNYARMKNASGVDTLVPVCRDPYCTGCQLNSHLLANSTAIATTINSKLASTSAGTVATSISSSCLAGCIQCDHKPPANHHSYSSVGHTAAAYAHAQLAALANTSHLPYVCNWIAGDTAYCGKRFSSSDELLQHLRSHTSGDSSAANSAAAAAAAATLAFLPPTHPLFSRTYPTPPLSPLATARYHPYGKASALFPSSLSSLGLAMPAPAHPHSIPGLPPYFSPYSLYGGPRLGAASGLHH